MSNSTVPPLQGATPLFNQLYNQLELVTPTTVAGILYGIAFTLFCLYVHALAPQLRDRDRKRQAKFMLAYSTVIMLFGLYGLVLNTWVTQDGYITHSNYPGGPFAYITTTFRGNPMIIVGFACLTAIDILTSAIQVWRVWVVWSATRYVILVTVLPTLFFLTFSAVHLRTVILQSVLPAAKVARLDRRTITMENAFQGATTILCTMLISVYLICRQRQQRKLIGNSLEGSTGYMSIAAMIIESYALESVWLILVVTLSQEVSIFFDESMYYIEILAYLLIQYRVASGKSSESQRGPSNIQSSLRWNHSNHATTQFGETCEIEDSPHVSAVPEASNTLRGSSMA